MTKTFLWIPVFAIAVLCAEPARAANAPFYSTPYNTVPLYKGISTFWIEPGIGVFPANYEFSTGEKGSGTGGSFKLRGTYQNRAFIFSVAFDLVNPSLITQANQSLAGAFSINGSPSVGLFFGPVQVWAGYRAAVMTSSSGNQGTRMGNGPVIGSSLWIAEYFRLNFEYWSTSYRRSVQTALTGIDDGFTQKGALVTLSVPFSWDGDMVDGTAPLFF